MSRGAWWAIVYGVTKNWTQLKQPSTHVLIVIIVPTKFLLFCLLNMATSFKTSLGENWKLLPQPLVALSSHVTRLNCSVGQTMCRTWWVGWLSPARQPTLPRAPVCERSHAEWSRLDHPPTTTSEHHWAIPVYTKGTESDQPEIVTHKIINNKKMDKVLTTVWWGGSPGSNR